VLPEHRHAAGEYEVEAARRIDERQPRVEREVEVVIRLLSSRAQLSERSPRLTVERELRDQRAALRLVDQDRLAGELHRPDAVQDDRIEGDTRDFLRRQREAGQAAAARGERL